MPTPLQSSPSSHLTALERGLEKLQHRIDAIKPSPRILDLAHRLVAAGPKAETHEISDYIFQVAKQFDPANQEPSPAPVQGDQAAQTAEWVARHYFADQAEELLAAWRETHPYRVPGLVRLVHELRSVNVNPQTKHL